MPSQDILNNSSPVSGEANLIYLDYHDTYPVDCDDLTLERILLMIYDCVDSSDSNFDCYILLTGDTAPEKNSLRCQIQMINFKFKAARNDGCGYCHVILLCNSTNDTEKAPLRCSAMALDELKATQTCAMRNKINHDRYYNMVMQLDHPDETQKSSRHSLLMIGEMKSPEIYFIPQKRNNNKCHRACTCGKCSIIAAIFEHTCPQACGTLSPHLHGATLMSYYSSDFLLIPADNWWRLHKLMMLPILGGQRLGLDCPIVPQLSSISIVSCDEKWIQTRKYAKDDLAEDDIVNTEVQFNSLQKKIKYGYICDLTDAAILCDLQNLANYALLLLLIAGDIETNPGPPRFGMFIKTHNYYII